MDTMRGLGQALPILLPMMCFCAYRSDCRELRLSADGASAGQRPQSRPSDFFSGA
jgi:hypothetical protein